jgi:alpha-ketoglutarate-dependent taurine dioxygenase
MSAVALEELAREARRSGWATTVMPLARVQSEAARLRWREVPTRPGEDAVQRLRPTLPEEAHPRSLSAAFGLEEQPLHTDGAHLLAPPDLVVLHGDQANETATLLWTTTHGLPPGQEPGQVTEDAVRGGLFLVRSGADSFLAPALEGRRYRYDPGCMTPSDERARMAVRYFEAARRMVVSHAWSKKDMTLVIDNTRALHARSAVQGGDRDRVLTRVAYHTAPEQ